MQNIKIIKYTPLALSALLCSASSFAQVNKSDIDEIIISATRTPMSSDNATTAITIVSKEDLAKQQIFQIADYLKSLPGATIASSGSLGGTAQLRMRGAEANQTLVMIDGVEMNDPAAGDEFQFEHLTANEIERIEIIRSPMSASWGSDALAGVINIVTRQADEPLTISGYGEYGSFDTFRGGGRIAAAGDKWKLSGGVSYMKSDGTNVSRVGDELDGYKNTSVNVRASYDISDTIKAAITVRHADTMSEFDGIDFNVTGLPADSDNSTDTQKTAYSASINSKAFNGLLIQNLRLTWLDTEIVNTAFGAEEGATGAEKLGLYFDNLIKLHENHSLTLAIDYEDTDFSQSGIAMPWGDPNQQQNQSNTGYIADYVGDITDVFTISAGLRYDDNSQFENITSWSVGASYRLTDNTRLLANTSRGQKAPTFIERHGFFSDQFIGNPDLTPEQSTGYEIGVEHQSGALTMSAVYFNTDLTDEINGFYFDPNTFMFTAINKEGESKRQGFELTIEGDLSDTISFSSNYTYLDATEDDGTGTQVRELRRPKHMASLGLYAAISDRLNVSAQANYTGKSLDIFFPPWPNPSERVELKDYVMLRIAADYKVTDNISVYGRVENAFNENYENVFGFATPNRAAYAGLRLAL